MERMNVGRVSLKNKIKRTIWNITYYILFRPFPTTLFRPWRVFILKLFGAKIGNGADVYSTVKIWAPWNLNMSEGSCLGPYVICYNQAMVTLESGATVSQYSYLCTAGHDTSHLNNSSDGLIVAPIILHKGAWIGTRAFVNMGIEIGEYAIVGATASVYKNVEAYSIVGGNPSKHIKYRNNDG